MKTASFLVLGGLLVGLLTTLFLWEAPSERLPLRSQLMEESRPSREKSAPMRLESERSAVTPAEGVASAPQRELSWSEKQMVADEVEISGVMHPVVWEGTLRSVMFPSGGVLYSVHVLDGKYEGTSRSWHENGMPHGVVQYTGGDRIGPAVYFHKNGTKIAEGTLLSGKSHGEWATWYSTGIPESIGFYEEGQEYGFWQYWDHAGNVNESRTGYYEDGQLLEED